MPVVVHVLVCYSSVRGSEQENETALVQMGISLGCGGGAQ
jgi:hypothetical protein